MIKKYAVVDANSSNIISWLFPDDKFEIIGMKQIDDAKRLESNK